MVGWRDEKSARDFLLASLPLKKEKSNKQCLIWVFLSFSLSLTFPLLHKKPTWDIGKLEKCRENLYNNMGWRNAWLNEERKLHLFDCDGILMMMLVAVVFGVGESRKVPGFPTTNIPPAPLCNRLWMKWTSFIHHHPLWLDLTVYPGRSIIEVMIRSLSFFHSLTPSTCLCLSRLSPSASHPFDFSESNRGGWWEVMMMVYMPF